MTWMKGIFVYITLPIFAIATADDSITPSWDSVSMAETAIKIKNLIEKAANAPATDHCPDWSLNPQYEHSSQQALVPAKYFLKPTQIPKLIRTASESVKELCYCGINSENCITITAIGLNGRFVTCEHAVEVLLSIKQDYDENPAECLGSGLGFYTIGLDHKPQKTNIEIKKLGYWNGQANSTVHQTHDRDLAILEIAALADTPPLKIASSNSVGTGQKVFHIGFPTFNRRLEKVYSVNTSGPKVSEGTITSLGEREGVGNFLGAPGTSGGPVLNSSGELVGLFWGKESTFREQLIYTADDLELLNKYLNGRRLRIPFERSYFVPVDPVRQFIEKQ